MFAVRSAIADMPRLADILDPERNSFGVLRCLMASLVLISHSYLFTFGSSAGEPLTALTGWSLGEHGVQVFFFLSGLMVAQSLDRSKSVADFGLARSLRIFPGLAVCVALTALVLGPLVSSLPVADYFKSFALPAYFAKTLSLATGSAPLPGVFENVPLTDRVNTSLWTLKYEAICYLLLAACGLLGLMQRQRLGAAIIATILVALSLFVRPPASQEEYQLLDNVRYFVLFFAPGVLAYLMRDKIVLSGWFAAAAFVAFVFAFDTALKELVTALFLGYTALWAATKTFGPLRAFCNRMDLSYGIYIYGAPVQQTVISLWPGVAPFIVTLIGFAIAVPLAVFSWILVERPSLKARSRVRAALEDRFGRLGLKRARPLA